MSKNQRCFYNAQLQLTLNIKPEKRLGIANKFLHQHQNENISNASKFSNIRYLGKGMESNAIFSSDIKANPTYDAFEKDIGILNVFFGNEMMMKYTMKNQMSTSNFMAQIGGSLGFAMGVSLISFVEIFYWMTFKLFGGNDN